MMEGLSADPQEVRPCPYPIKISASPTPTTCSGAPSPGGTPFRPTTSTTWSRSRPSSGPASRRARRSSSRSRAAPASTPTRPFSATWPRAPSSMAREMEKAKGADKAIPITLHLDHGDTFELCKSCIESGFSSVMIDGSHLPYEENIALTRQVVEYARPFDVTVEGELGVLAGIEDEVQAEQSTYTASGGGRRFRAPDDASIPWPSPSAPPTAPTSSSPSSARATSGASSSRRPCGSTSWTRSRSGSPASPSSSTAPRRSSRTPWRRSTTTAAR